MYLEIGGAAQKTSIVSFNVIVVDVKTAMPLLVKERKKAKKKHVEEKRIGANLKSPRVGASPVWE